MLATIINSTSLPVKGRRRGIGGISNWTELPWAFRAVTVLGKKTDSVYKWNPATKTLSLKLTILLWQGKLTLSVWNDQQLCYTATPLENQDNESGRIPTPANSSIQMSLKTPIRSWKRWAAARISPLPAQFPTSSAPIQRKYMVDWLTSKTLSVYRNIQTNLWLCSTRQLTDNCWEAKVPLLGEHKTEQNLPRIQEDLIWMTSKCPTSVSQNYGQLFAEYHDYFWYLSEPY